MFSKLGAVKDYYQGKLNLGYSEEVSQKYKSNEYGDIDGPFYDSMAGMFERAVEFIVKHELKGQFEERCSEIADDSADIGWGFSVRMCEVYMENFEDEADEGEQEQRTLTD